MSFQWGCAAAMLYGEIAITSILCISYISNTRWHKFFKLNLVRQLIKASVAMFYCALVFLIILLIDSTRETLKYQGQAESHEIKQHPQAEHEIHLKMFRAQRNFYISGVALFLLLVIYRLVKLISSSAQLQMNHEAFKKQAESANAAAQALLEENSKLKAAAAGARKGKGGDGDAVGDHSEVGSLKETVARLQKEAEEANDELEAAKNKIATLETAYDTLMAENKRLQKSDDKKDE